MVELKVTGMTCGHCENAVTKALAAVPGVTRVVTVSRENERVVVDGDADVQALVAAIEEEGYTAMPLA
jgi:copper chaperone